MLSNRFSRALSLSTFAALALATTSPEAQELRYGTTAPGGILAVGNTLGLSKASGTNGPGVANSIGTFLSLANTVDDVPANPANPWPSGTTYDWTQNGSAAVLTLPAEATVLYAELLWGGSFDYVDNVSAFLDTPVTLAAGGQSLSVTPSAATAVTESGVAASGFNVRYYMRSADVTAFVQDVMSGTYSVSGVPATQHQNINSLNAAGWTLVVAYRDQSETTKNLSVFVGGSFVDEDTTQDYAVSGFCAPAAGVVQGTASISAIEGDADLTGDQFLIAPTAAGPFAQLSAPNNPAQNFFSSQLNDHDGQLDTSGTFGMQNQDAQAGVNVAGGRQGWDVTTVPLSSAAGQLQPGQTSAVLRTITTGDSFMPILATFAIDVNAPVLGGVGSSVGVAPGTLELGDEVTVTLELENAGAVTAEDLTLDVYLPPSLSLVSFSTDGQPGDAAGNPVTAATLGAVNQGDLAGFASRTVTMTLELSSEPEGEVVGGLATWTYDFTVCPNQPQLTEEYKQLFSVTYDAPQGGAGGGSQGGGNLGGFGAGPQGGNGSGLVPQGAGGQGAGSNQGGEGPGDPNLNVVVEPRSCACELAEPEAPSHLRWLSLAALGAALTRASRRRRR
jgi:uncharacterized repeat protein (TIGR01451 family)